MHTVSKYMFQGDFLCCMQFSSCFMVCFAFVFLLLCIGFVVCPPLNSGGSQITQWQCFWWRLFDSWPWLHDPTPALSGRQHRRLWIWWWFEICVRRRCLEAGTGLEFCYHSFCRGVCAYDWASCLNACGSLLSNKDEVILWNGLKLKVE